MYVSSDGWLLQIRYCTHRIAAGNEGSFQTHRQRHDLSGALALQRCKRSFEILEYTSWSQLVFRLAPNVIQFDFKVAHTWTARAVPVKAAAPQAAERRAVHSIDPRKRSWGRGPY
jgi:hypothetical protein